MGRVENAKVGKFTADAAYAPYLRMKMSATIGILTVAGDEAHMGELELRTLKAGDPATIYDKRAPGTHLFVGNGAITAGDTVSSVAGGKVQDGSGGAVDYGKALNTTTGDNQLVEVMIDDTFAAFSGARSDLVTDISQPYVLPLESWKATGTGAALGASAGTPSGAFGLTIGTFGTATPEVLGEAASGNSKTDKMRRTFALPPEYVAGGNITLRIRAKETVAASQVGSTVVAAAYKGDGAAGLGSNLIATAAAAVTTTVGDKDMVISGTGLVAGDVIDIEITGVTNDTGGSHATVLAIYKTTALLSIKG